MWFREAFADQINPSWHNVHLDQLDKVCDKIEACVGTNKSSTRPKAIGGNSSTSLSTGAKQQLYYQSMQSFFDIDEEPEQQDSFLSFSDTLEKPSTLLDSQQQNFNNDNINENTRLLGGNSSNNPHVNQSTTLTTPTSIHSKPGTPAPTSSLTLRAYLQRENSLALIHSAATPFTSLSPELQKLETFYSALFLAELDHTEVFFKNMQQRVQSELLFLFAKCCDVQKARLGIHSIQQLKLYLSTHPDSALSRLYTLMAHYQQILLFFDQKIPIQLTAHSSPTEIDLQLTQFITDHATNDKAFTVHSRTTSPTDDGANNNNTNNNDNNNNVFNQSRIRTIFSGLSTPTSTNTPTDYSSSVSHLKPPIFSSRNQHNQSPQSTTLETIFSPIDDQDTSRYSFSSQPTQSNNDNRNNGIFGNQSPQLSTTSLSMVHTPTPSMFSPTSSMSTAAGMVKVSGNNMIYRGQIIDTNNSRDFTSGGISDDAIKEDVAFIEVSFRELSRCLHLLTSYCKLNKSALLHSLETHDQTGTPLKLWHQMSPQVNKTAISLHGSRWSRALISILVELYALFFSITDKKRAAKFLKSQAVVDKMKEPKTMNIVSYFLTSGFCTLFILILLYQFPHIHPWILSVLPLWRFATFIVTFILGLACLIYYCIQTNINYIFLLNLKPMTAYTHKSLFYHAAVLWATTTACMLSLIIFKLLDIHSLMFLPHTILTASFGYYFYLNSDYLLSSFKQFLTCAPTFQSSFIGDQVCSLTRLCGDILYIVVYYAHCIFSLHKSTSLEQAQSKLEKIASTITTGNSTAITDIINEPHNSFIDQALSMELQAEVRAVVKQFMWFITVTPFILRAIQCLRSYYHQSNFNPRHLGNTAKYIVAIVMSTFALLYKQALSFAPKLAKVSGGAKAVAGTIDAVTVANKVLTPTKKASFGILSSIFSIFSYFETDEVITTSAGVAGGVAGHVADSASDISVQQSLLEVYRIWLHQLQYIFLASAIITTLFQLVWDFSVDWGLFESGQYWPFRKKTIFKKNYLHAMKAKHIAQLSSDKAAHPNNSLKYNKNTLSDDANDSSDVEQRRKVPKLPKDKRDKSHDDTSTSLVEKKDKKDKSQEKELLFKKKYRKDYHRDLTPQQSLNRLNKTISTIYTSAMIANTIMRLFWIETLLPWTSLTIFAGSQYSTLFSTDFAVLILGIIEIIRRILWAYFRLENNQVNNNAEYHPIHFKIPDSGTRQMFSNTGNNNRRTSASLLPGVVEEPITLLGGSHRNGGNNNNLDFTNNPDNSLYPGLLSKNASLYRSTSQAVSGANSANTSQSHFSVQQQPPSLSGLSAASHNNNNNNGNNNNNMGNSRNNNTNINVTNSPSSFRVSNSNFLPKQIIPNFDLNTPPPQSSQPPQQFASPINNNVFNNNNTNSTTNNHAPMSNTNPTHYRSSSRNTSAAVLFGSSNQPDNNCDDNDDIDMSPSRPITRLTRQNSENSIHPDVGIDLSKII